MEKLKKANQKRQVTEESRKKRYAQIRDAMDQYKKAMDIGFYIEAMALMESAISDRMESTLNYLYPYKDYSFGTIGRLADSLMKTECFSKKLLSDIKEWARKRNNAIHQMVKLLPDNDKSFQERYDGLKQCAEDGKKLFRRLDNEKRKVTRYQESNPLIYNLKKECKNKVKYPAVLKIKCKAADVTKMLDNKLFDQSSYFEDENGVLWRKQLLDMYYDLEKT